MPTEFYVVILNHSQCDTGCEAWKRQETFLQIVQTGSQSASYLVLSLDERGRDVRLTTHLHLVLILRISGATLLLPLYIFMVWKGKILLLGE
jgi:hypothetical protein